MNERYFYKNNSEKSKDDEFARWLKKEEAKRRAREQEFEKKLEQMEAKAANRAEKKKLELFLSDLEAKRRAEHAEFERILEQMEAKRRSRDEDERKLFEKLEIKDHLYLPKEVSSLKGFIDKKDEIKRDIEEKISQEDKCLAYKPLGNAVHLTGNPSLDQRLIKELLQGPTEDMVRFGLAIVGQRAYQESQAQQIAISNPLYRFYAYDIASITWENKAALSVSHALAGLPSKVPVPTELAEELRTRKISLIAAYSTIRTGKVAYAYTTGVGSLLETKAKKSPSRMPIYDILGTHSDIPKKH